jgi:nucleoside recognition membrane protein YjiH
MRPVMRPLFRLPGRAALDDLMSWLGSYSVGLYLTRTLVLEGRYTRREAFVIVTSFSTVSVGFVGVVCSTLDLLPLFPLVFGTYFVVTYLLAGLFARTWPATSIPDETLGAAVPEPEVLPSGAWRGSWALALDRARRAPPWWVLVGRGLRDGVLLAGSLVGTILAVGTAALCVAEYSAVFDVLGAPLVPVLALLGLPDAELLAPAVLAGITEMYIPALLAREASLPGRFFVGVLCISQLIFFSSVAPMMLDMFREVPVRLHHLVALFVARTAVLVPLLAGWVWLLSRAGLL